VVSNNARNRLLDDIIAIRLTTTAHDLPTWADSLTERYVDLVRSAMSSPD
jgi:hypothetical protein